jgi:hypothetical protein
MEGARYDEYKARLNELNVRWRSNHRFMSEAQLRAYLAANRIDLSIRGDRLKYNSNIVYDLAESLVSFGVAKWQTQTRSRRS